MMIELHTTSGVVKVAPAAVAYVRTAPGDQKDGQTLVGLVSGQGFRVHAHPDDIVKQVDDYLLASLRCGGAL